MQRARYPRRRFIQTIAAAAVGASVLPACSRPSGSWRFFTEAEALMIDAISEQIIPTDQDPGAIQAGVTHFIDRQLVGVYQHYQQIYRTGLIGIQETSQAMFSGPLERLIWNDQTAVLKALESGKAQGATWQDRSSRAFFELIRDHTLQGYYGSPRHGGNRDYTSYRMLQLDYPQIVSQNRYRKL
jgi:gluconate 2-dehydrogenase gamma chain